MEQSTVHCASPTRGSVNRDYEFASEKISKLLCTHDADPIRRLQPCPVVVIQDGRADCGASMIFGAEVHIAEGHVRCYKVAVGRLRKCFLNLSLLFLEI